MQQQIQKYQDLKPSYEDYSERIKSLIQSLIQENKIKYQLIESRTKSLASFRDKILRKDNKYSNPLEEITDLVGIRVVVYYQDDVDKIEQIIKNEFIIDDENSVDKRNLLKTNEFGYQSVHYVIKLADNRNTLLEWKKFANFKAELQIRTVLQHAWAAISHELEYKKNYDIPSVLRRKLFRLASLIELADEEFKQSRDQHIELVNKINTGKSDDCIESNEIFEELNLLTLTDYVEKSSVIKQIFEEAIRAGFKVDQIFSDKYLSQIIHFSHLLDIRTIPALNQLLENSLDYSYTLFSTLINNQKSQWSGNKEFFVLLILIYNNINFLKDSSLLVREQGWGKGIAELVLETFRNIADQYKD